MEKTLIFERAEYETRVAAVKNAMAERGLDLLLVSEPPNLYYLTGYDAYSFYTPQLAIVSLKHEKPVFVTRSMDKVSARMTTYLTEDSIFSYPDSYVNSETLSAYEYMSGVIRQFGGEKATIGVEMGGYYYSARAHADLVKALPNAKFADADLLVNWIRLVKSPAELVLMRQAGQIGDAAIKRAFETAEPGLRECDLAAAVYHQQISGTPEFGGNYDSSALHFGAGQLALAPHPTWTDKPLPESTTIYLEVHGNRRRYQINVARTIVLGKPSPSYEDFAKIAIEATDLALESVRPGRTCSEVHRTFANALSRHGIEKEGRLGYPTGIGYPPAAAERTASFRKGDDTVLQPGMCFHMMSGLWLEGVSVAVTQPFAVTENGYEQLTKTPRKLLVK